MEMNYKRVSLLAVILIYIFVLLCCLGLHFAFRDFSSFWEVLLLDLSATVLIFIFSKSLNNVSVYDPYWSVAPFFLVFLWTVRSGNTTEYRVFLVLILILIWGVRLTVNWAVRWKGLKDEDWRYAEKRTVWGKWFWPGAFAGFFLMPTLVVFFGCLSLYPALVLRIDSLSWIDFLALFISGGAILIESESDRELQKHIQGGNKKILNTGIWKWSRHPNYFGEVLFWTGMSLFSINPEFFEWYVFLGPGFMIILFVFISIPMMDRRMSHKPGFEDYKNKTSAFIPFPPLCRKNQ